MIQDFTPVKQICAHLNAFHVYANDPTRCVEANHYCTHLTEGIARGKWYRSTSLTKLVSSIDVRQCLIYDSPGTKARLIGIEYMVSPRIFETLPPDERKLWHTHEFEVKSGMLIMPAPTNVPTSVWEAAETAEMHDIAPIYGKTYHLWQVDRGDVVPMGEPQLMGSFTSPESVVAACPGGMDELRERIRWPGERGRLGGWEGQAAGLAAWKRTTLQASDGNDSLRLLPVSLFSPLILSFFSLSYPFRLSSFPC